MKIIILLISLMIYISSPINAEDLDENLIKLFNQIAQPEQVTCPKREDCTCIKFKDGKLVRYTFAQFCPHINPADGSSVMYEMQTWDTTGNKVDKGLLLNGKHNGLWISWYPNGVKESESFFENGYEEGKFIAWHDNGAISVVGYYRHGKNHGTWIYKNKGGKIIKKLEWDNGKLISEEPLGE
jgi:antitoxin component YwqK of YwqJK toxin-antitoxin module